MTSKDETDKLVFKKIKSKNSSSGGDPNDNPSNGGDLIEKNFFFYLDGSVFTNYEKRF